jgi:TolA-binding protein
MKMKDLKNTLRVMRTNETQLLETVARLQRKPMVSNADIQCDIDRPAKEELREIEQISRHNIEENHELRDALMRQGHDIERLIEEKRDLEDLIEQQNQSIKQIRQQQHNSTSIASIHSHLFNNTHMKENHNSLNKHP